ncbi:MAG: molybdenum cofactor biosynthesis protein [Pyrinomonadaceae bacterium]|nr:molybdenum cofactor biosynthesis protein MoaE [Pyrinomonadaceae bacterium]MDQ3586298.1 molybdenum cofactor biosynthesis protein MoaE [Acidobacteriota bacterium]
MSSNLKQHRPDSTAQITVRLFFFGAAREAAGRDEAEMTVHRPATAATVFAEILDAYPRLRGFGRSLLLAVNEKYARPESPVHDGDEIAVFPPVSGGAEEAVAQPAAGDQDFFELTTAPLDIGEIARRIVPPHCGATVTLDGYAREFTRGRPRTLCLVYEAYPAMALREMRRLGQQAHAQFDIAHIGIVHRTGRLEIGETSVVITVSAPHRRAAFEACEWAIKELKRTVPIWKKEFYEDGAVWIEGEGAPKDLEQEFLT